MAVKEEATENPEPQQPKRILVIDASEGAGVAVTREAVRRGYQVFGTTLSGSDGAFSIREAGALPLYPEIDRVNSWRGVLAVAQPDVIINLAPQALIGIPQFMADYDNLLETIHHSTDALLEAAGHSGIERLIQLSSTLVYGNTGGEAATEDTPTQSHNKIAHALLDIEHAALDGGIPALVVRAGHIYGGNSDSSRDVADYVLNGFGVARSDKQTAWIHEDDLASLVLALIEYDVEGHAAHVINAVDDTPLSPRDFNRYLGENLGSGEPSRIAPWFMSRRTHEIQRDLLSQETHVSNARAKEWLNWTPVYPSVENGMDSMLLVWRAEEADHYQHDTETTNSKALTVV